MTEQLDFEQFCVAERFLENVWWLVYLRWMVGAGLIEYIAFPEALKGKYQSFTQADIAKLRSVGYANDFASVEQGVTKYVQRLAGAA